MICFQWAVQFSSCGSCQSSLLVVVYSLSIFCHDDSASAISQIHKHKVRNQNMSYICTHTHTHTHTHTYSHVCVCICIYFLTWDVQWQRLTSTAELFFLFGCLISLSGWMLSVSISIWYKDLNTLSLLCLCICLNNPWLACQATCYNL